MIDGKFLLTCILAVSLFSMAFGTTGGARELIANGPAQVENISAAKKTASSVGDRLKARGATMVPRSELPVKASSARGGKYTCDKSACWCTGVKSCLKLTDKVCKFFRCNDDGGQPACWCDL